MLCLIDSQHAKGVKVGELSNLVTGNGARQIQLSNYFFIWCCTCAHCKDRHAWLVLCNDLWHEASLCMYNDKINAAIEDLRCGIACQSLQHTRTLSELFDVSKLFLVVDTSLCFSADFAEHGDSLDWELASSRFVSNHQTVNTIQH